jgi:hypothetical protein
MSVFVQRRCRMLANLPAGPQIYRRGRSACGGRRMQERRRVASSGGRAGARGCQHGLHARQVRVKQSGACIIITQ